MKSIWGKIRTVTLIPSSIWALGIVSLCMDTSSELIHSLLPVFMVSTLGVSMTAVGIVEGIAEATALIVKIFSGTLSDYFRKRKLLTVIGYGLAAATKPIFPLANSLSAVLSARFLDRVGKGIRGAPRDAMIGDLAPAEIRGRCFGLRQSLDTVGAFLGPLLAIAGMLIFSNNIRAVLWIAVIPAIISVIILVTQVTEPPIKQVHGVSNPFQLNKLTNMGSAYWRIVLIAGILSLAKFSEAFLIIKAQSSGLAIAWIPLVLVMMNIVYSLGAYPAGILSDHVNRKVVLIIGILFLIMADLFLGIASTVFQVTCGIIFWGLHLAFTQGLLATLVTDTAPAELRGTAYGIFNFICGIAMLFSSLIAGILWDHYGSTTTFFVGAIFSLCTLLGLILMKVRFSNFH